MPTDFVDAFTIEAISFDDTLGIYGGSNDPWVDAPDAPVGSVHFRTNGTISQKEVLGNGSSSWGDRSGSGSGGGVQGCIPFFNASGVQDNILTILGKVPFYGSDGLYNPINTTGCN